MIKRLSHGKKMIRYRVIQSKRIKTSEIIVQGSRVIVRTPLDKEPKEVERIVRKKADWILRKQVEWKKSALQFSTLTFAPDSFLPYLGNLYPLRIVGNYRKNGLRFVNGEFLVTVRSKKSQKKTVRLLYERWLKQKAKSLLPNKVKEFAKMADVKPRKVLIKQMRSRWGSATKSNIVSFNQSLVKAPEEVIDYIVFHELCHLKIRDHSYHFWSLLGNFSPDYEKQMEWLRLNARWLVEN